MPLRNQSNLKMDKSSSKTGKSAKAVAASKNLAMQAQIKNMINTGGNSIYIAE